MNWNIVMRKISLFLVLLIIPVGHLLANDGFGALGVGGVNLEKTDDIAIISEQLDISYKEIHVLYRFKNEGDRDIESIVSFPLPQYDAFPSQSGVISKGEPFGFSISVNGEPVRFTTKVQALFKGADVTPRLKDIGFTDRQIMDMPFKIDMAFKLENPISAVATTGQLEALTKEGLIDENGLPSWQIQVIYYWSQKFPAHTEITVAHKYRPFVAGGTASGYAPGTKIDSEFAKEFCTEQSLLKRLDKLSLKPGKLDVYSLLPGTIVDYILTTANTWKDGVRNFTLRIHKNSPQEIVALCFSGNFVKINETILESKISNYYPKENLHIYFANIGEYDFGNYGSPPR